MTNWTIQEIWNSKLNIERKDNKERDYINASDIGKPFIDRWYKMKAIVPTNPYDERILRIFDCGNIFEWIVERVFRLAGILQKKQTYIEIPETKEHLKILGYLDFLVGGVPNWNEARKKIKDDQLPDWLKNKSLAFIDQLEKEYPNGLIPLIAEIKSVNSLAFWAHKNRTGGFFQGYEHHKLQLLTYLIAENQKEGRLFYISKDDLTLQETPIMANSSLIETWQNDIREMSHYYRNDIKPDPEPDIVFNAQKKQHEINWKMARSIYLTKITGLSKEDWEKQTREQVKLKNKELKEEK